MSLMHDEITWGGLIMTSSQNVFCGGTTILDGDTPPCSDKAANKLYNGVFCFRIKIISHSHVLL